MTACSHPVFRFIRQRPLPALLDTTLRKVLVDNIPYIQTKQLLYFILLYYEHLTKRFKLTADLQDFCRITIFPGRHDADWVTI